MSDAIEVVWFKRDLRTTDHAPLARAAEAGPCLGLYVYEDSLLASPEFSPAHLDFINQALDELETRLGALGGHLLRVRGEVVDILDRIHDGPGIATLWSHEETGNAITYRRDRAVARWAEKTGVTWMELPNHGVFRRLRDRDGWSRRWARRMAEPLTATPVRLTPATEDAWQRLTSRLPPPGPLTPDDLGWSREQTPWQSGGEGHANDVLNDFLATRGRAYSGGMSSPVTAFDACSRLSPHLAWGTLSMRTIVQATRDRRAAIKAAGKRDGWGKSLSAFAQRLRWHCHFMQKLEDEPELEFRNLSRIYDGLREDDWNEDHFQAWANGQTGYPMVDACMRALLHGGWINFRMRAMLVSFASYHLWLHWPRTAQHLGRLFLDFEPGIHYPQVQMQSGTTGINTVRIYSPSKQVLDQDPTGVFIRQWCPELSGVPDEFLAQPETMSRAQQEASGCVIGRDYPAPIVEHTSAYRQARQRIYAVRRTAQARSEAEAVYDKHGSRRRPSAAGRGAVATRTGTARAGKAQPRPGKT
ncbi:MAG: deoxyribodipyrimidine photo-lyase/cryptochrome family protein [Gammaproteobacteria bacterium]